MKLNLILLAIVTILIIYYWRLQVNKRGATGFSTRACTNGTCGACPQGEEIKTAQECQNSWYGGKYNHYNRYYGYYGGYWGGSHNWGNYYPKGCWTNNHNGYRYWNTGGDPHKSHYRHVHKVCGGKIDKDSGDPWIQNDTSKDCPAGQELDTEAKCRKAQEQLKKKHGSNWWPSWHHAYNWYTHYPKNCWLHQNRYVYFNRHKNPTNVYNNHWYARKICGGNPVEPSVKCPKGWEQVGAYGADIAGCGMDSCDARYDKKNIDECVASCKKDKKCKSITWAPMNADKNHKGKRVCTRYTTDTSTGSWDAINGKKVQTMCKNAVEPAVGCPDGWEQVGAVGADIGGCGMDSCSARYGKTKISECAASCKSDGRCLSFTWAPLNGDKNHEGKRVCTRYTKDTPTGSWNAVDGTKTQTMCKQSITRVTPEVTNDFWKGISACGCDWTTKHSAANFDGAQYKAGDYKWCWAPDSTHPSHKHNCENKTKHSMCRLNSKGHCVTRYQVPKATDQGASKGFTNKVLKVKKSGLCLQADGGKNGSIKQKICSGEDKQLFSYNPKTLELKTKAGECLDIAGASRGVGAAVQTYPCKSNDNQSNQRFYSEGEYFKPMHWYNNNSVTPRDHKNGLCLSIQNNDSVIGRQLIQGQCKEGTYQQFEVTDDDYQRFSVL